MGLGLGALLKSRGTHAFGGVSYLAFVAPGVLAAAAMQTAAFESSYPTIAKIKWSRTYEAMLATPLQIPDLLIGELVWTAVRLMMVGFAFFLVMAAFGVLASPLAILAVPAAALTGLAFSAPVIGFSAGRKTFNDLSGLFRFGLTPLFLFSGSFFPVSGLPKIIRPLAYATPLYHGVRLVRGLTLGTTVPKGALVDITYLGLVFLAGTAYALHELKARLLN